jgi:hypothetical protein
MNWLRKWQAIVNRLYELRPWKSTKWMWLVEFEDYIIEHKAELLDHLYNISDENFNNLIINYERKN